MKKALVFAVSFILFAALAACCAQEDPAAAQDQLPFLMAVEDVFVIKDVGVVATGVVERGTLHKGDELRAVGLSDAPLAVTAAQITISFGLAEDAGSARTGDVIAVLMTGVDSGAIERGMVLAAPDSVAAGAEFSADVALLAEEEGGAILTTGSRAVFVIRTAQIEGTVTLPEGVEAVRPGESARVSVRLAVPAAIEEGLAFGIAQDGRLTGSGVVAGTGD